MLSAISLLIVISEIAWMGTVASSNDEWTELYNPTDNEIEITGWTLKAKDGTPSIILQGKIPAKGYFLLERTDDNVISDVAMDQKFTGALGNSGEYLELRDKNGNLIDEVDVWYAGNNDIKASMERAEVSISGKEKTNWKTNNGVIKNGKDSKENAILGTPKAKNSAVKEVVLQAEPLPQVQPLPLEPQLELQPQPPVQQQPQKVQQPEQTQPQVEAKEEPKAETINDKAQMSNEVQGPNVQKEEFRTQSPKPRLKPAEPKINTSSQDMQIAKAQVSEQIPQKKNFKLTWLDGVIILAVSAVFAKMLLTIKQNLADKKIQET